MKYSSKNKNPFKSVNKEIEERAQRYILKKYSHVTPEIFRKNKEYYVHIYFDDFPIMKQRYNRLIQERKNIAVMLTVGTLAVGMVACGANNIINASANTTIEQTMSNNKDNILLFENTGIEGDIISSQDIISNETTKTEYKELLKEVEKLTKDSDVNYNRKQIIAEAYNSVNPSNPITVDRLDIIVSTPDYLIVKKDKLNNIVETRMKSSIDKENKEEKIEGREVYKYYIDQKLVAVYDKSGTKITDSTIQKEESFFRNTVEMVYQSERLKDVYRYQNSDKEVKISQERYVQVATKLKEKSIKEKQNQKSNEENTK